jgi:uncharacterized SAM-binding protein YcdF (DUF218 family)
VLTKERQFRLVRYHLLVRVWRIVRGACALLGLCMVLVTVTPLTSWTALRLAGPWTNPHGDVLVVLAGSSLSDGELGLSSYWRGVYASMAYREGGFRRVLITGGGDVFPAMPVSYCMQKLMILLGVPAEAISIETTSSNTHENATLSVPILNSLPGRKVLLTSDYHMYRARRAFAKAGIEMPGWPYPDAGKRAFSWKGRWSAFLDETVEFEKILYYKVNAWI